MFIAYRSVVSMLVFCGVVLGMGLSGGTSYAQGTSASAGSASQTYQDLFALSQKEKRGLTFYVRGQAIPGIVTRVIGAEAVEVRNQTHGRIIIRLDRIDALAIN